MIPTKSLDKIKRRISNGDPLLFLRTPDIESDAIAVAGRSDIVHAGMAAWREDGVLCCLETLQGIGGRQVPLAEYVDAYPGRILVKKLAPEFRHKYNRAKAVAKMREIVDKPYGWWAVLKASLIHLTVIRWFVKPETDDNANGSLPYCSMAVSRAMRAGNVDPVRKLGDGWTEPGDLDRSAALVDYCYLVP